MNRGIEFLFPKEPLMPSLNLSVSEKAFFGEWQSAQACELSPDKIGSKNNFFPKAIPSTVCGLSIGVIGANIFSLNSGGVSIGLGVGTYFSVVSFEHENQIKTKNKKKNEVVVPPVQPPLNIEREYHANMRAYNNNFKKAVREQLFPLIEQYTQFTIAMPKSWNEGTVSFKAYFTGNSTNTGTVAFKLAGVGLADGELTNIAFGTAVQAEAKAHSGVAYNLNITRESGAITIAGTPVAEEYVFFEISRDVSEDNFSADALLLGIKLFFTTDAGNDS